MTERDEMMSKRDKIYSDLEILDDILCSVSRESHFKASHAWSLTVSPSWKINKRYIDDFHLLFVRGGRGWYNVNGHEIELKRGRVVFVGGSAYYAGGQYESESLSIIPMRFELRSNGDDSMLEPIKEPVYFSYDTMHISAIEFLFLQVCQINENGSRQLDEATISSLLQTILSLAVREMRETGGNNHHLSIEKTMEWMKEHPLNQKSIDYLARKAGISKKYFTKLFKAQYGVTPKRFQLEQRMNYAMYLLQDSDCSVKEVSAQVGYSDQYIFSKQFKKIIGGSPSDIKKGG